MNAKDNANRRRYAASEWAALRDRLLTVTPHAVGRALLTAGVVGGGVAIVVNSWPAFLPFIVGGLIAYTLVPVVNALDRVMPRSIAAAISVLGIVAAIVAIAVLVLPPLTNAFVHLAGDLPTSSEIEVAVADLEAQLGTSLPDGSAAVAVPVLTTVASTIRDVFSGASGGLDEVVRAGLGALLGAVGALLGLIVLPTWMLTVIGDWGRARAAIDRRTPSWLRTDLWAIVAIVDRAAGSYLRGYVVVGGLVGMLAYLGLAVSPRVGGPTFMEPLALAVIAGVSQLVPVVGPLIGLFPGLLILPLDPTRAGVYVLVYLGARILGASVLGGRLMERRLGVHPAILVPGVVMIGQFGVLWLLLSAPIVAISVDLVRYVHGRLSEPSLPAGVLPRSAQNVRPEQAAIGQSSAYRTPVPPPPIRSSIQTTAAATVASEG